MLFYQVGELFQSYAVGRSRQSIAALMDIRPDYANVERDGRLVQVDPEEVAVGDIIVVKPGEKIPLDGVVLEGASAVEHRRADRRIPAPGRVAGRRCDQRLYQPERPAARHRSPSAFGESTVAKILDLVENSSSKKARAENFITKFARYYTPAVVIAAASAGRAAAADSGGGWPVWSDWIHRALIFLVISCPCALGDLHPAQLFRRDRRRFQMRGFWSRAATIWRRWPDTEIRGV